MNVSQSSTPMSMSIQSQNSRRNSSTAERRKTAASAAMMRASTVTVMSDVVSLSGASAGSNAISVSHSNRPMRREGRRRRFNNCGLLRRRQDRCVIVLDDNDDNNQERNHRNGSNLEKMANISLAKNDKKKNVSSRKSHTNAIIYLCDDSDEN